MILMCGGAMGTMHGISAKSFAEFVSSNPHTAKAACIAGVVAGGFIGLQQEIQRQRTEKNTPANILKIALKAALGLPAGFLGAYFAHTYLF